jgi:2-amino-4-hydroxy-6-hydroxymethyldihydropteridine diphosphokinase
MAEAPPSPAHAYLSLGSNIAPERNLPAAVKALGRYGKVVRVSRVWESTPVGFAGQANFLNAAVLLETNLLAAELHDIAIAAIEHELGRVRDPRNRNAPRTMDIDISLYNRDRLQLGRRRIPDPDILTRAFVAVPLSELDPTYVHPEVERTLAEIAAGFDLVDCGLRARTDVRLL